MKKILLLTLVLIASISCFGQTGEFERDEDGNIKFESSFLFGVVPESVGSEVIMSLGLELMKGSEPRLICYIHRAVDSSTSKSTSNYIPIDGYKINILDIVGFKLTTSNGSIQCSRNVDKGSLVDSESEERRYITFNKLHTRLSQTDLKILRGLPKSGFKLELLINHYNDNFQSIEVNPDNLANISAILSNSARQLEILKDLNL